MAAALFRNAGYYFGDSLLPASAGNIFGYYEDTHINEINWQLICRMMYLRATSRLPGLVHQIHRDERTAWLAAPPILMPRRPTPELEARMRHYVERTPFCLKDPRFNVTLPTWRPYLPKPTRFLVVFREPDRTVDSILLMASREYSPPLPVTPKWAYLHWARNYRRLLDRFADDENWLFVDYNSIIEQRSLPAIQAFSQAQVDGSQLDPSVSRSKSTQKFVGLPEARRCYQIYERLCSRSARDIAKWTDRGNSPQIHGPLYTDVP